MKFLITAGVLIVLVSSKAFSGGLETDKVVSPAPPIPLKAETVTTIPLKAADPIPAMPPDCRPASGNSVTNHGAVTNGGDSVNTKVVCQCETKACEPKVVEKAVPGPTKIVEKKVPGPTKVVEKVVYVNVNREVPGPTVYVNKECPTCEAQKTKNWSLGMLMGAGPSGVHVYKYGDEYKANEGGGILVGVDLSYRFLEHWNVGGLYINNDTKMFRAGFNF